MQKTILFIHGAGTQGPHEGSGDLVASLQETLGAEYNLYNPEMPGPDNPRYNAWRARIEKELGSLPGPIILVGHSLGGSVLLKYMSENFRHKHISALFLVAVPFWGAEDWQVDEFVLRADFTAHLSPDLSVLFYHSRDDQIVPFSHLGLYAQAIPRAVIRAVDGHGHEFIDGIDELVLDIGTIKTARKYRQGQI